MKLRANDRRGRPFYVFKRWYGRRGDPSAARTAAALRRGAKYSVDALARLQAQGALIRPVFAPEVLLVAVDAPRALGGSPAAFWKLLQRRFRVKHACESDRLRVQALRLPDVEAWLGSIDTALALHRSLPLGLPAALGAPLLVLPLSAEPPAPPAAPAAPVASAASLALVPPADDGGDGAVETVQRPRSLCSCPAVGDGAAEKQAGASAFDMGEAVGAVTGESLVAGCDGGDHSDHSDPFDLFGST
eukprot:m51a1_g11437 hypothetical protein (246) ;mRNA; r:18440-19177